MLRVGTPLLILAAALTGTAAEKARLDYGRDIRPILAENCFTAMVRTARSAWLVCGWTPSKGATAKRGNRAALVRKARSQWNFATYNRRTSCDEMPPVSSNRSLTAIQIRTLNRWIEEGGEYSKHWAFVPPTRPAAPAGANDPWIKQTIDAFVLKRLRAEGLQPNSAAAPSVWLRRVSLDLIGLPPTPSQIADFSKDVKTRGEKAYGDAVDGLLHLSASMASVWQWTGSMWRATPIRTALIMMQRDPCGAGVIG